MNLTRRQKAGCDRPRPSSNMLWYFVPVLRMENQCGEIQNRGRCPWSGEIGCEMKSQNQNQAGASGKMMPSVPSVPSTRNLTSRQDMPLVAFTLCPPQRWASGAWRLNCDTGAC